MEDGGDVVVKNGSDRKLEFIALYQSDLLGNIKLTNLGETLQDQQPADVYTAASVSFVLAMASRVPMGIRFGNSVDVLQ
ncbi:hypothetical protein BYT27DRAFT_7180210 [Phlegmacium glaucopus]|nr:hypothetical protein BYT27DRAFT_7180210 [Phlegmacium glaucopus]